MLRRWHILGMIAVIVVTACLLAAAKLRATPKFDRIHEGMTVADLYELLGASDFEVSRPDSEGVPCFVCGDWELDEGRITVILREDEGDQPIRYRDGGHVVWGLPLRSPGRASDTAGSEVANAKRNLEAQSGSSISWTR